MGIPKTNKARLEIKTIGEKTLLNSFHKTIYKHSVRLSYSEIGYINTKKLFWFLLATSWAVTNSGENGLKSAIAQHFVEAELL